jgi:hypothetical protein
VDAVTSVPASTKLPTNPSSANAIHSFIVPPMLLADKRAAPKQEHRTGYQGRQDRPAQLDGDDEAGRSPAGMDVAAFKPLTR